MNNKYDSDYEIRLATLEAMGGDVSKRYDSVYEIDLEILRLTEEGGGGGIPEAPEDGKTYGRKDGDWAEVQSGDEEHEEVVACSFYQQKTINENTEKSIETKLSSDSYNNDMKTRDAISTGEENRKDSIVAEAVYNLFIS